MLATHWRATELLDSCPIFCDDECVSIVSPRKDCCMDGSLCRDMLALQKIGVRVVQDEKRVVHFWHVQRRMSSYDLIISGWFMIRGTEQHVALTVHTHHIPPPIHNQASMQTRKTNVFRPPVDETRARLAKTNVVHVYFIRIGNWCCYASKSGTTHVHSYVSTVHVPAMSNLSRLLC